MRLTLIITTYERSDALAAVLRSVARQSLQPYEVIVADDGSGPETAEVVKAAAKQLNIIHEWRKHDGFRVARMRNCAIARASCDYIVSVDGDILLHRDFLTDHAAAAKPNCCVTGGRVFLDAENTRKALERKEYWPSIVSRGVGKRHHLVRLRLLSRIFRYPNRFHHIRSCNMAFWRKDAFRINGFNEDFVGWGAEDSDFIERLKNSGVVYRAILYNALVCHLTHPAWHNEQVQVNYDRLAETRRLKLVRCENGLNRHADGNRSVG